MSMQRNETFDTAFVESVLSKFLWIESLANFRHFFSFNIWFIFRNIFLLKTFIDPTKNIEIRRIGSKLNKMNLIIHMMERK